MPNYRLVVEFNKGSPGLCAAYQTWRIDKEIGGFFSKSWEKVGPTYHTRHEAEWNYILLTEEIPTELVLKTTKTERYK